LLNEQRGAFLLGVTAPDVRCISPIPRWDTHFYSIPPDPARPSIVTIMETWPSLARATDLGPAHASFVAGYVSHLWFDEFWQLAVIYPYCVRQADWGSGQRRFGVYNVLLGYLDRRDKNHLPGSVAGCLQVVQPAGWLPFVPDADLAAWRDYLVEQLQPGAQTHTAAILARRAHMTPDDFAIFISDEERIRREVFSRIPAEAVEETCAEGQAGSAEIIQQYLGEW